ncbi:MAG: hypothetical protein ACE15B_22430 [Bryobacteraceae bacterium]
MRLWHLMVLAAAPGLSGGADWLQEPGYIVAREGGRWVVQKPAPGGQPPLVISRHPRREAAEFRAKALPRVRFSGLFVRFDPRTHARTVIADWTAEEDARRIDADLRGILSRFAPAAAREFLPSTPLYMARLSGATGHTAEDSGDATRFVIYLDPFRATGRLHAAATIAHELAHVQRYRARGFHANRAAAVLTRRDFVLLGLADEFAAFQAEAGMVRAFLENLENAEARRAAREALRKPELRWPPALIAMLGSGERTEAEARRQIVLDVERIAGRYWDSRHGDALDPSLRAPIHDWYTGSREWRQIAAQRPQFTFRRTDSWPSP